MRIEQIPERLERIPQARFRPFKWAIVGLLIFGGLWIAGSALGWLGKAATVVKQEVDPRTVLDRYEWFIEQWNAIQEQDATLDAFKAVREDNDSSYGEDRSKWPLDVRREFAQQTAEIRGILANRNRLASEYRAAIQKINYVPATMLPHFPATVPTYVLK